MGAMVGTFEGQGWLVVGDTDGVGALIANEAGERGADLVLAAPRTSGICSAPIPSAFPLISFLTADLADEDQVDRLYDAALSHLRTLGVLVNILLAKSVTQPEGETHQLGKRGLAEWESVVERRLRESFLLTRRAVEELVAVDEGGRIIYVIWTGEGIADAALETAMQAFTRSVAKEYGRHQIYCNAVVVGRLESALGQDVLESQVNLLHRRVADVVIFLASADEASFVNGEVIRVA